MERGRGFSSRGRGSTPSSRGTSSSRGRGRGARGSSGKSRLLYDAIPAPNLPLARLPEALIKGRDSSRPRSLRPSRQKRGRIYNYDDGRAICEDRASGRDFTYDNNVQRLRSHQQNGHKCGADGKYVIPSNQVYASGSVENFLNSYGTVNYDRSLKKNVLGFEHESLVPTDLDRKVILEDERSDNEASRERSEQRRRGITVRGGRGSTRDTLSNRSIQSSWSATQPKISTMVKSIPAAAVDPFSTTSAAPFPASNTPTANNPFNPFASSTNPFNTSSLNSTTISAPNSFRAPSQSTASNPFGKTLVSSGGQSNGVFGVHASMEPKVEVNPFGSPSIVTGTQFMSPFSALSGLSSTATANPFGTFGSPASNTSILGAAPGSTFPARSSKPNTFSAPALIRPDVDSGSPSTSIMAPSNGNEFPQKSKDAFKKTTRPQTLRKDLPPSKTSRSFTSSTVPTRNSEKGRLAVEIESLLLQNNIVAPKWPTSAPGDPRQKAAIENFWQVTKVYRAKVRTCLMRNGYLDDPDKPKKLSEAIDFKGTCEEMCPEFEKITRIMEHDVQGPEKELQPDGETYWPSLPKMVKALARSAAGQDAPLPDDVRSPAALRRTLDYLIDSVLGHNKLESVHGFLWDRTRAIRRDFVFQQASMSSQELVDQVYCLELITRFHVIALHQMSEEGTAAEDFSEQQEVEQLGKALLSLIHAYEDCLVQGIPCENESEFRAYYVVFNSQNTGILEAVQDWGYNAWRESDEIRTAVGLVEALQNAWDTSGPLRPHSSSNIALNAFRRFFIILEDSKVSYTMACFAEIHFHKVRKAALKTILAAYRKQRDQTKDWTLTKLNEYLFFDEEDDIVPFGEAYGLHFDANDGEDCLAFDSDDMVDPFPQLKQSHSKILVERKRGHHVLPEAIRQTVYEDPSLILDEDDSMFVPLSQSHPDSAKSTPRVKFAEPLEDGPVEKSSLTWPTPSGRLAKSPENSISKEQKQLPQTQPLQAVPAENTSFGVFHPQQQGLLSENKVTLSSQLHVDNSGTGGSSVFSFLSQNQNAPSANFNLPRSSLFGPKEGIEEASTVDIAAQPAPAPTSLLQIPTITNGSNTSSEQQDTKPFPNLNFGGMSKPTISSSPFQFPAKQLETDRPISLIPSSTVPFPSTAYLDTSASLAFNPQAKTHARSSSTKTPSSQAFPHKGVESDHSAAPAVGISPPKPVLGSFPEWIMLCKRGLIEQFTEITVEGILKDAVNQFLAEAAEHKEKLDRETAEAFRRRSLAMKYGDLWRKNAHLIWLRRKGRRARDLRRQMAEERRKSLEAQKLTVVEDFKKSQRSSKQKAAEKLLANSGNLDGVHTPRNSLQSDLRGAPNPVDGEGSPHLHHKQLLNDDKSPRNPGKSQSTRVSSPILTPNRRLLSEDERKSIMKHGLTLPGGSFIGRWSPEWDSKMPKRQSSGVKTDYFRLKARGIVTLPDGTPLAKMAAIHLDRFTGKRPFDSISQRTTSDDAEEDKESSPIPSAISSLSTLQFTKPYRPIIEPGEDVEAIKARAREIMAAYKQEKESKQHRKKTKRLFNDEAEEELFAKAKRIREQMDEGAIWYKEEIGKSQSRSSSQ